MWSGMKLPSCSPRPGRGRRGAWMWFLGQLQDRRVTDNWRTHLSLSHELPTVGAESSLKRQMGQKEAGSWSCPMLGAIPSRLGHTAHETLSLLTPWYKENTDLLSREDSQPFPGCHPPPCFAAPEMLNQRALPGEGSEFGVRPVSWWSFHVAEGKIYVLSLVHFLLV